MGNTKSSYKRNALVLSSKVLLFFAINVGGMLQLAQAETPENSVEAALVETLTTIGFDGIKVDECIVQAGIDRPTGSPVTRFEFNINLIYLDFQTVEILNSSHDGKSYFRGIIRFGEEFRLNERLRREFRWYVFEEFSEDWTNDIPPRFGPSFKEIEIDLERSGISQDTFYRFYRNSDYQTFPYFLVFDFTYDDREIVSKFLTDLENLARQRGC